MLRSFAQILLVALILTTPLSCCGDKCTNFLPDFNIQTPLREQTRIIIPVLRPPPDISKKNDDRIFPRYLISLLTTPCIHPYRTPVCGRSPPASLSYVVIGHETSLIPHVTS